MKINHYYVSQLILSVFIQFIFEGNFEGKYVCDTAKRKPEATIILNII